MADGSQQVEVFLKEDARSSCERLTVQARREIYRLLGLSQEQEDELEAMIARSPARLVGQFAKDNVRGILQSKKNGAPRLFESHTCELVFAYELELDPDVIGYYTQVPCAGIRRMRGEKAYVSGATIDFLVFRRDLISLVECKYESTLEKEALKTDADYKREDDGWIHGPYAARARELGLGFSIWVQQTPMGLYLQNLEACYALFGESLPRTQLRACRRVRGMLQKQAHPLERLNALFPEFNERASLWMIANGFAYGLLRSSTPIIRENFYLFARRSQAEGADAFFYARMRLGFEQPDIWDDPILSASATDLGYAEKRLARLAEISVEPELATVRMTQLAKQVAKKVADGMSPLAASLTSYRNCGQATPSPLTVGQRAVLEHVIQNLWNKGQYNGPSHLWHELDRICKDKGEPTPCQTTLNRHIAREDPCIRAFARGGLRPYQAARPRAGADKRSLPPLGYGFLLIVDSSGFDARCAANLLTLFPAEKPRFYIGIDGATGDGMAHAFIFGSARTDGFAILLREYVNRHGFLPRVIQVDRGSENTSHWLVDFCRVFGIILRHAPTGGSPYNGAAENAIKHVNTQVAHRFAGNTLSDMADRKVDGRFKSRKTATHTFSEFHTEFCNYVYLDMPKTPDGEGLTPEEKRADALETIGCLGKPCELDDAFRIHTSIKIDRKAKGSEKGGIRTNEGRFNSDDLQRVLRTQEVGETRSDCADPTVLWVKVGRGWWKAFHRSSQVLAAENPVKRLFHLLFRPYARRRKREDSRQVASDRHLRQVYAAEAREATKDLAPAPEPHPQKPAPAPAKSRKPVDWSEVPEYGEIGS